MKDNNPFKKAHNKEKRLKLFLWGDSGVGKTTLALQFPNPAVIDLEGGTDWYGDSFSFDILDANTPDQIMKAVDFLLFEKHEYKTLVIDPVTVYWESLQKKWSNILLKRNPKSKGFKHEFFDLQPKDWMTIKNEFKEFIRKITMLNMNVIVTAREKTKYADGTFMKAMGETFDGDKSLPYMFDTILRLYTDGKGKHMGTCLKDRSNSLPKETFECSYSVLEEILGKDRLNESSHPVQHEPKSDMKPEEVTEQRMEAQFEGELDRMKEKIKATFFRKIRNGNDDSITPEAMAAQATTLLKQYSAKNGNEIISMDQITSIEQARLILEEI